MIGCSTLSKCYDEVTATTRGDGSALFSADQLCRGGAISYDQYGIGLD